MQGCNAKRGPCAIALSRSAMTHAGVNLMHSRTPMLRCSTETLHADGGLRWYVSCVVRCMTYRPEIDGLRAIAVLAVLLFHLDLGGLPGGYVGVDVFFVISGYLITAILQRDIADGCFSITRFYERRIRRI